MRNRDRKIYSYSDRAIRHRTVIRARRRSMRIRRFLSLFVLACVLAVLMPAISSYAGSGSVGESGAESLWDRPDAGTPDVKTYKYYDSICIRYGDTLTSIANKYCSKEFRSRAEYIDEVKSINHMTDDKLITGDYIVIPYYSSEERYL